MSDQKNDPKIERRKNEILGLFLITFAAISYFAIFSNSAGLLGDYMSRGYYFLVGSGSYILPLLFVYWGIQLIRSKTIKFSAQFLGLIISFIAIISIINLNEGGNLFLNTPQNAAGGVIGGAITYFLVELFAVNGAYIILSVLLLIGILLLFDLFLHNIFRKTKAVISSFNQLLRNLKENIISFFSSLTLGRFNIFAKLKENRKQKKEKKKNDLNKPELESKNIVEEKNTGGSTEVQVENAKNNKSSKTAKMKDKKNKNKKSSRTKKEIEEEKNKEITEDFDISKDQSKDIKGQGEKHGDYTLPGISLLNDSGKKKVKLANKSELLEETLNSFGVEAKVINVNHGPTITRYEIQPATGVKVSKIVNLSDDSALALAARDVRIEAPIPGKAAVGIEVPHGNDITVSFRDVIVSEEFQKAEDKLTLALGKGIDGDTAVFNLAKMPHLLVAGATGSGKSVCINTLISSILYRATPEEVKLLLIDPKKVELNIYQGLPHLITPVVTDSKKAANVLKLVVEEMENRYDLFSDTGSRGIESYNEKLDDPEDKMPI